MLCRRRRRRASIRTTLGQCLVSAGLRSQLISKLESLTQCKPDSGPRSQHWADISPALAYQYIGLNKINFHPMLAYCWPIVYDHGSAVKQHWLKVSFLQGTPATQYPDTMLVQCWKSVIDDGTTFNQHWVSASKKEAVASAERKYILDLQVNKYGLSAALWQEETGRQLKSSKCLVYQGADIAF